MAVQPYLFFDGTCEAATEFYKHAVGAQVTMLMRYKDSPEPPPPGMVPPGFEDKVMHMTMTLGDSVVMGADDCTGHPRFGGFSLSLTTPDEAAAQKTYAALAAGGNPTMPLTKTFFSPGFGMLTDKFGVGWMIMVEPQA